MSLRAAFAWSLAVVLGSLVFAGCGRADAILCDGSRTAFPITAAVAEGAAKEGRGVVSVFGAAGGGFPRIGGRPTATSGSWSSRIRVGRTPTWHSFGWPRPRTPRATGSEPAAT